MDKSGEIQGHQVNVKQQSGISLQDYSRAKVAAMLQSCVCQKKYLHIMFP